MKLCVLMPAYNEERYIESAISSIFSDQGDLEIELVIVDDGSTDGTVQVVNNLCQSNPYIRLITQKNQGVSASRNTLLKAIPPSCDLVTFLDGDDAFTAGWLVEQCALLERDPTLDLVYGQICTIESDKQDLALQSRQDSLISRTVSMSCGIYRPELLKKNGIFDLEFVHAEDMDYLLRMFEADPTKYLSDNIAVLYRQHSGNITRDTSTARRGYARAILRHIIRRKHNPKLASLEGIFILSQTPDSLKFRRR